MSKGRFMLSMTLVAMAASLAVAAPPASRLATYDDGKGTTYFALSLPPTGQTAASAATDVVVLFDTSASQTGLYRLDGLNALKTFLGTLGPDDRVKLVATDLNAIPMTGDFVAPTGAAIDAGLAKLEKRVPLGTTDMGAALDTAVAAFESSTKPDRAVVYIGDGISGANFLGSREFQDLTKRLVAARVPVTSYAIGPERDIAGLAALANHTGGQLFIDSDEAGSADKTGAQLAGAVHATVVWPTAVRLADGMGEVFPRSTPPLRSDRDTVLFGVLEKAGSHAIAMTAEFRGRPIELTWNVDAEKSSVDFSFLPRLVELARENSGTALPTLGSDGLREVARMLTADAERLARLGENALRIGDGAAAAALADEASKRIPGNVSADQLRGAVERAGGESRNLRLTQFQGPAADAENEFSAAENGAPFLSQVEESRRRMEDKLDADVERIMKIARDMMSGDPDGAILELKNQRESVLNTIGISAGARDNLVKRLSTAIREAEQRANVVRARIEAEQRELAEAQAIKRALDDLDRKQSHINSLMAQFDQLIAEGEYRQAEVDIAQQVRAMEPYRTTPTAAAMYARYKGMVTKLEEIREKRHRNFAVALLANEEGLVPFTDEYPIEYPDAEEWERISNLRAKYKNMDLLGDRPAERKIYETLQKTDSLSFNETPLNEAIDFLAEKYGIPMVLDKQALDDEVIDTATPVTVNLPGITLRNGLRLMLEQVGLTYIIDDEVLQVTTQAKAETKLITKVYPVGDLVVPIAPMGGGMGGMMGGMMGGGMGGGMGGMGGGMGGMGGMGGGMGGMGGGFGGGGGGFFAVEEDLRLGTSKKVDAPREGASTPTKNLSPAFRPRSAGNDKAASGDEEPSLRQGTSPSSSPTDATPAPTRPVTVTGPAKRLEVSRAAGVSQAEAWDALFSQQMDRVLSLGEDREQAIAAFQTRVRQTVRELMHEGAAAARKDDTSSANDKFTEVTMVIQSALRHGFAQPWMYEAMTIALQAAEAPREEIERTLMSAVDFSRSEDDVLLVAAELSRQGFDRRALRVYREFSSAHPHRSEPYLHGMRLGRKLNDLDAVQWSCVGVLSQAWPQRLRFVEDEAKLTVEAMYAQLMQEERAEEAKQLEDEINGALVRDCLVVVSWTGDADIDVLVEEPNGSICSLQNTFTSAGGVMLGDSYSTPDEATVNGYSETYVCPVAFSGDYRMLLRRVWGEVAAGKVTVDIVTNLGTKESQHLRQQIDLGDKDALVLFDVKEGRRQEPIAEKQIARLMSAEEAIGRAVLAQLPAGPGVPAGNPAGGNPLSGVNDPQALRNLLLARQGFLVDPRLLARRGAVGYMPVVQPFPEGTNFFGSAIISADRKYVRYNGFPLFSGIGDVATFNFVSGQQGGQQGGRPGQVGGGPGNFGGGFGGGFFALPPQQPQQQFRGLPLR